MGSSTKRRQTMEKVARERALKEKRERKQEKKEARKAAAAAERNPESVDGGDPDASEALPEGESLPPSA